MGSEIKNNEIINELRKEVLDYRSKLLDRFIYIGSLCIGAVGIITGIVIKEKIDEFDEIRDRSRLYIKEIEIERSISKAIVLAQQDRYGEAVEEWRAIAERAEEIDSERAAEAWFNVGHIYCFTETYIHDLEAGIEAYNRAIFLKPEHNRSYSNRALARVQLGQHQEALEDCDKAIRLDRKDSMAYNTRCTINIYLHEYNEALSDCDRAIELDPSNPVSYNNRGQARLNLGRYKESIEDFDKSIELIPTTEPYYNRGKAKIELGLKEEAREDFEIALDLAKFVGNIYVENEIKEDFLKVFGITK